jgi:hypothetical protein
MFHHSRAPRALVLALALAAALIGACDSRSEPAPRWDPVCHCFVAQFSPSVTRNLPPVMTTRRGVPPGSQWPDPEPRANVPVAGGTLIPDYPFPAQDVTEAAFMGRLSPSWREVLEFFVVGPNLAAIPPGGVAPGAIVARSQDAHGNLSSFTQLAQGVLTSQSGGPLGSSQTRTMSAQRVSATIAPGTSGAAPTTHAYVCVVDNLGHLILAERRGQPTTDPNGAPIPEGNKWSDGSVVNIWRDLNVVVSGAPSPRFVDVACAAAEDAAARSDQLHILGVAEDGRAWHSLATRPWSARTTSSFSPFAVVSTLPQDLTRIATAANEDLLHVVALSKDQRRLGGKWDYGQPWHVGRTRSGWWSPAVNVRAMITGGTQQRGYVDVAVGFCNEGVVAPPQHPPRHLNVALLVQGGSVDMTVQTAWSQPWGAIVSDPSSTTTTISNSPWLHGSQWDGALDVAPSRLTPPPLTFTGIALFERPYPPG